MIDWKTIRLAGFDLETTGFDGRTDRIVQYAFSGALEDSSIVNPGIAIKNSDIHGITDDIAAGGMRHEVVASVIANHFNTLVTFEIPVVIMNARFDLTFCYHTLRRSGLDTDVIDNLIVLDPMIIDRELDKWRPGKRKLGDLAWLYVGDVSDSELHGAVYDSALAIDVMRGIGEKFNLQAGWRYLHSAQRYWGRTQAAELRTYFSDKNDSRWKDVKLGWPVALS